MQLAEVTVSQQGTFQETLATQQQTLATILQQMQATSARSDARLDSIETQLATLITTLGARARDDNRTLARIPDAQGRLK